MRLALINGDGLKGASHEIETQFEARGRSATRGGRVRGTNRVLLIVATTACHGAAHGDVLACDSDATCAQAGPGSTSTSSACTAMSLETHVTRRTASIPWVERTIVVSP